MVLTATSGAMPIIVAFGTRLFFLAPKREKPIDEVQFSMAIRNVELMHECFPKHSRMGTARIK